MSFLFQAAEAEKTASAAATVTPSSVGSVSAAEAEELRKKCADAEAKCAQAEQKLGNLVSMVGSLRDPYIAKQCRDLHVCCVIRRVS